MLSAENAGCAGARVEHDDARHPCVAQPVATVKHRTDRARTVRLLVCEAHAVGQDDPRPLTDHDRAELRRRERRAQADARRRAAPA